MKPKERKVDDESDGDTVQLELEGFAPQAKDRDGIVQLLNQLLPKDSNLHLGGIADFIIEQGSVGTVVKSFSDETEAADDDDIVFSLTTIISFGESVTKRSQAVCDLRDFLTKFIERAESSNANSSVLLKIIKGSNSEKPGLLLNERFVNLPPTIASQAVAALPEEVKSLPDEERPSHLIVLTRALKSETSDEILYIQPEMELVRKVALAAVQTNVVNNTADGDEETIIYVVMAIEFSSLPEILDMLANIP